MLGFGSRKSKDRQTANDRRGGRRWAGGRCRRAQVPRLEGLEVRITPATATWTGAGTDGNWMNAANWAGGTAPHPGDDLVFPGGATKLNAVNDFPAGTSFNSLTITGSGYTLSEVAGDSVSLSVALSAAYTSGKSTDTIDTTLGNGTVTVSSGGELDLGGVISGTAGLSLSGGGVLDLKGTNTYTGTTTVSGLGTTLFVDGTTGSVQVNSGGTLGGTGTVGAVTSVGGRVSPGESPGVLNTGSLMLDSNSTFVAELDGTTPGNGTTGYDQVVAGGAVNLGGATLDATVGGGYTPAVGDMLTIIKNNSGTSVIGNFAGLAEGSAISISGSLFRITYQGGSSAHDVVLTRVTASSTTTITPAQQTSNYGQTVTFSAQVTGGQGTPTGSVGFFDGNPTAGGTALGTIALNAQGIASGSISSIGVAGSPHQIFAVYIPDPASTTYAGSTSATPASLTVNPATLTVTGVVAENKVYNGTTAAQIDTSGAALVGVLPSDQGNVALNATGATASFADPNAGTGKLVIVSGLSLSGSASSNYVLTQPTGLTATIIPAPLTLTANNQTMNAGGPVPTLTFTATGLVNGETTATALSTQPTLTTTATSSSPPGTYPITITDGVAPNYTITDVNGTLTVVHSTATTTTLSISKNLTEVGQITTITAQVTPVSPSVLKPTGTVTFLVDGNAFRTVALDPATGLASFNTTLIPFGQHTLTAVYSGDANFQGSQTSVSSSVFVTLAGTQATVTPQAARNRHGQFAVNLVAHVVVTPPGSGTPTGTVTFFRNGRVMRTVPLNNGTAILQQSPIRLFYQYIYVYYNGDSNFEPSVSRARTVLPQNLKSSSRPKIAMSTRGQAGAADPRGRAFGPLARWAEHRHSGPRQSS